MFSIDSMISKLIVWDASRDGRIARRVPHDQLGRSSSRRTLGSQTPAATPRSSLTPVRALSVPGGPGVRDDRGVAPGFEIPMLSRTRRHSELIVWDASRDAAIARLRRVLDEYRVVGVKTTVPFFQWLVDQPDFVAGRFDTPPISTASSPVAEGRRLSRRPTPTNTMRWSRPRSPHGSGRIARPPRGRRATRACGAAQAAGKLRS